MNKKHTEEMSDQTKDRSSIKKESKTELPSRFNS